MKSAQWVVAQAAAALMAAVFVSSSARAGLVVSDGEFRDPDWFTVTVKDTTPTGDATGNSAQVLTGGNPAEYRQTTHDWQVAPGGVTIVFGHLTSAATYVQATMGGAISTVDYGFDINCFSAPLVNAVAFGIVAQQGPNYFTAPAGTAIVGSGWTHVGGTLTESSFTAQTPATALDFSASGGPIVFGYYSANGGSGASFRNTAISGVDNFSLRVSSVPEPGAAALLLAPAGLLLARRRR